MRVGAIVLAFTVLLGGCGGAQSKGVSASVMQAPRSASLQKPLDKLPDASVKVWQAVRTQHRLHFQAVFLALGPDDGATIVVTEPPPHARPAEVQKILGADVVGMREWPIGYDGLLRDIVAVVAKAPAAGEAKSIRNRLADLHQYLFHSTYRAKVFDPFEKAPSAEAPVLDLALPAGALHDWVLAPNRRFSNLDGGEASAEELRRGIQSGVFRASDVGVSLWAIPDQSDLCDALDDARNFALETDLLLGGLKVGNSTVLVGRTRTASLAAMPPLRTEMLLGLIHADPHQLAQSYERTNLFAGRLKNGSDWAPILLSSELVDTELGGLLNVTDQLLKSWSMNGIVKYHNFTYRNPERWASAKVLTEELATSSVTFNWNTSGAMTGVEWAGVTALVSPRTGALPIAYIPEGSTGDAAGVGVVEERNQNFFATQNDPNLVRVVGYTTFYHLAKEFRLQASSKCWSRGESGATEPRTKAETYLEGLTKTLLAGGEAPHLLPGRNGEGKNVIAALRKAVASVESARGPAGVDEFIHYMSGVSSFRSVAEPSQNLSDYAASVSGDVFQWAARGAFDPVFDRDGIFNDYVTLSKRAAPGYIVTPSVVVSRAEESTRTVVVDGKQMTEYVVYFGGHNLRLVQGTLRVDPSATEATVTSPKQFGFEASIAPRHLKIDPRVLQRTQKAVQDGRISPEQAKLVLDDAAKHPTPLPDLRGPFQSEPGVGFDVPRQRSAANTQDPVFQVRLRGEAQEMYDGVSPDGHALEAGSTRGILDGLTVALEKYRPATTADGILLELSGFSELRAQNFAAELAGRLAAKAQNVRRVPFVAERPGVLRRFREWLKAFRAKPSVEVSELEAAAVADSSLVHSYRIRFPGEPGSLVVRVHARLTALVRSSILAKLRGMFGTASNQSLVERLEDFCNKEHYAVDVSLRDFGPPPTEPQVELRRAPAGQTARVATRANDG